MQRIFGANEFMGINYELVHDELFYQITRLENSELMNLNPDECICDNTIKYYSRKI